MTIKEQYDQYLDDLHDSDPGALFASYPGSRILQEVDPTAYRVGMADFEPTCEECGETIDDYMSEDSEAICADCAEATDEEED